jgi:hypothetical protein
MTRKAHLCGALGANSRNLRTLLAARHPCHPLARWTYLAKWMDSREWEGSSPDYPCADAKLLQPNAGNRVISPIGNRNANGIEGLRYFGKSIRRLQAQRSLMAVTDIAANSQVPFNAKVTSAHSQEPSWNSNFDSLLFALDSPKRNRSRKNAGRRRFGELVCFQCNDQTRQICYGHAVN